MIFLQITPVIISVKDLDMAIKLLLKKGGIYLKYI